MSPAMVEVRNPRNQGQIFTPNCDQHLRNPSPNPTNKGQIFTPLFDQNPFFFNPQQEKPNPNIKNMNQSSNKPSLSKARLVKARKKVPIRKPQPIPNSEKIEEKIYSWNPFVPDSGARVSESSNVNANAGAFGFTGKNFDAGKFVFGNDGPNLSQNLSCQNACSFDSVKSEGIQLMFGSGVEVNDGSSQESSLGSEEGLVFSKLLDETGKMDLKSSGRGDDFEKKRQIENGFMFGGSSVNGGKSDAGYVVFGSGVKKSVDLNRNSSIGLDEGSFSKLPDEVRKLNSKSSGNVNDFGKKKQAENVFVFRGSKNVIGSTSSVSGSQPLNAGSEKPNSHSISCGNEGSGNSDEGVFIFGSGTNISVDASGLEKGSFFKLRDEMRKLNLKNTGNVDDFEKNKQTENVCVYGDIKAGSRSTGSVSASQPVDVGFDKPNMHPVSFGSEGSGYSAKGVFVFGSGTYSSVDANGLEKGSFSKLPDEMRKLNLKNSGNVGDFEKNKQAENVFAFVGSTTRSRSSSCSNVNKIQESAEFASFHGASSSSKPINIESKKPSVILFSFGSEGNGKFDASTFVFGSGGKRSVDLSGNSSLGSDEGLFFKLPDEMRKMNLTSDDGFEKLETADTGTRFGGDGDATSSFPCDVANKVPEETWKLNVGREASTQSLKNDTVGSAAGVFVFGSSTEKSSVSSFDNDTRCAFVSGSSTEKSSVSSFDNDTSLNLPIGNKFSTQGLEKDKEIGRRAMIHGGNTFIFGTSENTSVSLGGSGGNDALHDDMGKLNIGSSRNLNVGRETATQSMTNETVGSAASAFLFGNSTEKSSVTSFDNDTGCAFVSGSSTEKSSASSFDNDTVLNLSIGNKFSTQGLEKDKEMGRRAKVDGGNSFVLGTSENTSSSLGGSGGYNALHDGMGKLNIGSNTEKFVGSVPFEFTFQGGKHYNRSNMNSIPSSPAPSFQYTGPSFSFTGKPVGLEIPHMEFKTPKRDAALLTKETLFTVTSQNMSFSAKKSDAKKTKTKKKSGKPRPAPSYQNFPTQFVFEESEPQASQEVDSAGDYSPMDYSPYHEELIADQYSREPSVASEDSINFFFRHASTDAQKVVSGDEQEEVLVSEVQRLNISEGTRQREVGDNGSEDLLKRTPNAESVFLDEQIDKFGNDSDIFKHENVVLDSDARTAPMVAEAGFFSSNMERPAGEGGTDFTFSSSLGDLGETNFKFAAVPSVQGPISAAKHTYRRKSKLKSRQNPSVSTPNARVSLVSPIPDLIPHISTSDFPDSAGQKSISSSPQSKDERKTGKSKESNARQESTSSAADIVPVQEACEKWRFRGNQAYAIGHLTKAEDYYTRGVNSVSLKEIPSSCIKPLSLCYSNRAATRMSLGKWREALKDCKMAVSLDPYFLKARVRVANCHLALGEIGEALNHFKKCLQAEKDISSGQKYIIEASDGLQKAQQVADLTGQSAELLLRRTSNDASRALSMISEALLVSPHSESLLEMKAEALLVMRNYEDVIKLCEQTLDFAEQNSVVTESDSQFENVHSSEFMESSPPRLWRWRLIAKSYFYLGQLEEALELLQKYETAKPAVDKSSEASTSFGGMVRELLRLKSAGNEAFQAARHSEAAEYYSSALACNVESRPFAAVCFCNRAAAYQALGQITDAIADCSLAIALDPSYAKAISRRATLHELIRDYGQAANDLNRLISLLQKQMQEKDNVPRGVGRSSSNLTDLKRARARLATMEEEARKGLSLNMYMILGIEPLSSSADVKKAYRKAALRHHPDKAGQFLVRNENVDDGLWREVGAEVHVDTDRLFKMIGEAYATLSDPTKRLQYDEEEEMRACPIRGYNVSSPRTSSDYTYSTHHEKSFNRHRWRPDRSSYQKW